MRNLFALILIGLVTLLFNSCGSNDKSTQPPPIGEAKIFAIALDTNGKKFPTIIIRVINKAVKYDSLNKKDIITIDTIYGVERFYQNGVDSLGRPKMFNGYFPIGKDSVWTNVCNTPLDSLLKK